MYRNFVRFTLFTYTYRCINYLEGNPLEALNILILPTYLYYYVFNPWVQVCEFYSHKEISNQPSSFVTSLAYNR